MSSLIEEIVLKHLTQFPNLEKIDRGYIWRAETITTTFQFRPVLNKEASNGVDSIAVIESIFEFESPGDAWLALANKRAIHGYFFESEGRVGVRMSFSIYEEEPASEWICEMLLRAFGEQGPVGFGNFQSMISDAHLAANRANLEFPRIWATPHDPSDFAQATHLFRERGLVSNADDGGLILEVPLASGGISRMVEKNSETALLHVSVSAPHPLAGVGYFASIALPFDPQPELIPHCCQRLNDFEFDLIDHVPRMGAWGMRGLNDQLAYTHFFPCDKANPHVPATIMNWIVQRTIWVRDNFWTAGSGINLESMK